MLAFGLKEVLVLLLRLTIDYWQQDVSTSQCVFGGQLSPQLGVLHRVWP